VKLLNTNRENIELMQQEINRKIEDTTALQSTYLEIEKQHFTAKQRRTMPEDQVMIYVALRKGILDIEAHLAWLREVKKITQKTFAG